ncbi:PF13031 family protein [Leptospira weilii str. 2006001853]|uniref:PF13031 family protein n=1 Tax=Leptospira weilii str. 2006001853 TaxID=1001589 RepID=A0A828Z2A1_9LEPT|nr:DUF3892 domain-containing protein [Leptospira weilii]EKR64486.1 PF13031 family protein [Leptospira weilii str. 2006001853]OMI15871.1 hypothetical protein BUQ74_18440 [Leptospira weilii serovar Heyan]QDK22881.1 DUF3892 domain-containing protein [Leptospira weilii]QDK27474.1 DUF3892 domain-containing protein [Leptospira weilii]ULH27545.1 DUF3892 domain-containing protein [Leptospira weilii]
MSEPNYYVSAIRKNQSRARIEHLKVSAISNSIDYGTFWTRESVRNFIKQGFVFYTVYKDSTRTWRKGAHIKLYGDDFLTTDRDSTSKDNLENLPEE